MANARGHGFIKTFSYWCELKGAFFISFNNKLLKWFRLSALGFISKTHEKETNIFFRTIHACTHEHIFHKFERVMKANAKAITLFTIFHVGTRFSFIGNCFFLRKNSLHQRIQSILQTFNFRFRRIFANNAIGSGILSMLMANFDNLQHDLHYNFSIKFLSRGIFEMETKKIITIVC